MNLRRPFLLAAAALVVLAVIWFQSRNSGENTPKADPNPTGRNAVTTVTPPRTNGTPAPAATHVKKTTTEPLHIATSVLPGLPTTRTIPSPLPPHPQAPNTTPADLSTAREAASDLENVQFMLRDFRSRMGENPVGTNSEIMKAVMGENPAHAHLGPPEGQSLNEQGELIDRWGTPYFFHQLSKDLMEIHSAGPDGKLWTGDDVISK